MHENPDERLARLLAAWRRGVDAEPLPPSLCVAALRRRWLGRRTSQPG
ncbi:hypothetical protein [Amycolatopsis sp. NPDC051903]